MGMEDARLHAWASERPLVRDPRVRRPARLPQLGGIGTPDGTYTFGTSFVRPLVAGPTGVVEPGECALAAGPQALLARLGNLGGVGAPGRVFLQLYDEYAFSGAGSMVEWELTASLAPTTTAPEPGTWALLGTGLLGIAVVGARRRRATPESR